MRLIFFFFFSSVCLIPMILHGKDFLLLFKADILTMMSKSITVFSAVQAIKVTAFPPSLTLMLTLLLHQRHNPLFNITISFFPHFHLSASDTFVKLFF